MLHGCDKLLVLYVGLSSLPAELFLEAHAGDQKGAGSVPHVKANKKVYDMHYELFVE